jgi:uncharacterized protein with HEPN domain
MKNNQTYLHHILDAIDRIETYMGSATLDDFHRNGMLHDAVLRQILIIGEASRNISDDFQSQHTEIPWGQVIGMRNRVVHAYFDIDLDIAWDVVQVDLPALRQQIQRLLR